MEPISQEEFLRLNIVQILDCKAKLPGQELFNYNQHGSHKKKPQLIVPNDHDISKNPCFNFCLLPEESHGDFKIGKKKKQCKPNKPQP